MVYSLKLSLFSLIFSHIFLTIFEERQKSKESKDDRLQSNYLKYLFWQVKIKITSNLILDCAIWNQKEALHLDVYEMTEKLNFIIRKAVPADLVNIFKLLKSSFFPYEALSMSMGATGPESPDGMTAIQQLDNGMTLVAVLSLPNNEERIIGVCNNTESTPDTWKKKEELMEKTENIMHKKILKLLITSHKIIDVWNVWKINKCFDIHILAVDPEFRGKNVGIKLCDKSIEMAKLLGYKLVYIECTGIYSARIAEQLNMKCVYSIAYKDYKEDDGKPVFNPPYPHKELKIFTLDI